MVHESGFAVDDFVTLDNAPAECLTNDLVAQADAADRDPGFGRGQGQVEADTGPVRITRTGGQNDRVWFQGKGLPDLDPVVPLNENPFAKFTEKMNQVEREAVIVVDQQDHSGFRPSPRFPGEFPAAPGYNCRYRQIASRVAGCGRPDLNA